MKIKSLFLGMLFVASASYCSVPANGATMELKTTDRIFPSPAATWEFTESPFALKQITENVSKREYLLEPAGIRLRNGRTIDDLSPDRESVNAKDGILTAHQEFSALNLTMEQRVADKDDALQWEVTLNNASSEELWIEVKLGLPVKTQPADRYWDGFEERAVSAAPFLRKEMSSTFPVSLLYGADYGLAVGFPPSPDISSLQNGISRKGNLFYSTKFVVSPGKSEKITFLLYLIKPTFGSRDAAHGYYRRFPAAFEPFPGVDSRLADGRHTHAMQLGHYHNGIKDAATAVEVSQYYGSEGWFYAPFFCEGDYVGRREYWDRWNKTLIEGERKYIQQEADHGTWDRTGWERFHKTRSDLFKKADMRGNMAAAFYIINHVEKSVAEQSGMVSYAVPRKSQGLLERNSVLDGANSVYYFYPWATPYEKILRRDLPEVVKEIDLSAFAHDNYFPNTIDGYRGKLDYHLPGWSYDEKGKFISESLGYRHEAEFIHTLRKDDRTVGLIANDLERGVSMLSHFAPDAYLLEMSANAKMQNHMYQTTRHCRLFGGHKPVYYNSYCGLQIGKLVPWETLTPEQCRAVIDDFLRDFLICQYQTGSLPSVSWCQTYEVFGKELPTLLEVMGRGFEPASACVGSTTLERVRYGANLGSALVLSNRSGDTVKTEERLIPEYLGEKGVVFPAEYRGGELKFKFDDKGTSFPLSVAPMENKIVSFPVALRTNGKPAGSGQCVTELGPVRRGCRISLNMAEPVEALIAVAPDPGFESGKVTCNGKPVAADGRIQLAKGANELLVETVSSLVRSPFESLSKFPFDKAVISIPVQPAERESAAALMIQDFMKVRLAKSLSTVSAPSAGEPAIRIERLHQGEKRGVTIEGSAVVIRGGSPFDIQQVTWDLLRFLDRYDSRFGASHGTAYANDETTKMMLEKAGLNGKWVKEVRIEKRLPWNGFTASSGAGNVNESSLRVIVPPLLDAEPKFDGTLDDPIWKKAAVVKGFTILGRKTVPTQDTETFVYRTKDALFIGFKCYENNIDKLLAQLTDRDSELWHEDSYELRLAPGVKGSEKKYAYYTFIGNTLGTQFDSMTDARGVDDAGWNADWKYKAHRDGTFWSGEIRIPFKAMKNSQSPFWRVNFSRNEKPGAEYSTWSPISGNDACEPMFFGIMKFE